MQTDSSDTNTTHGSRALFYQQLLRRAGKRLSSRLPRLILIAGVLLYLGIQLALVSPTFLRQSVLVELDDAYTYIIKAVEMQTCFFQDCPALNDLRSQLLASSDDPEIAWLRYREYSRAFFVYHPLHSIILLGLKNLGFTWETAYEIIYISGLILLGGSITLLLYTLWGSGPAGIALGLLALNIFPRNELHYISPSQLSLAIALLTFALVLRKKSKAQWVILIGIPAMIAMHTIGRLYALITLMMYGLLDKRPQAKTYWVTLGMGTFFLAASFLLPLIIMRPELSILPEPAPENWGMWLGLRNNLREAYRLINDWIINYEGIYITGLLVGVGILSSHPVKQKESLYLLASLILMLFAGLLVILPRYPAEVFSRIWTPTAILLTGYIGQAFWVWLHTTTRRVLDIFNNHEWHIIVSSRWILSLHSWGVLLIAVFGLAIIQICINVVIYSSNKIVQTISNVSWVDNISLDSEQPGLLISQDCKTVLYMSEIPMHFYFTRGALDCGALFYPAFAGTTEEDRLIHQNDQITHLVSWNPLIFNESGAHSFNFSNGEKLTFISESQKPLDSISLYLHNSGREAVLNVVFPEINKSMQLHLLARQSGWVKLGDEQTQLITEFNIKLIKADSPIFLRGLRVNKASPLNWPWDEGIQLSHAKPKSNKIVTTAFTTKTIFPDLGRSLRVLADNGDTILAEVGQ